MRRGPGPGHCVDLDQACPDGLVSGVRHLTVLELLTLIPLNEGTTGFRVVGELDMSTAPKLSDALAELESEGEVVLDLQELTFIDSTGIHVIFTHALSRAGGPPLVLANPSHEIMRTLEILGLAAHPQLEVRTASGR
jgi:anti-anti-sigma factor